MKANLLSSRSIQPRTVFFFVKRQHLHGVAAALEKYSGITYKKAVDEISHLYELLADCDGASPVLELQRVKHNQ